MVELKTTKEIFEYDVTATDNLYDYITKYDADIEVLDTPDIMNDDVVQLTCKPTKEFNFKVPLKEISALFISGSLDVESDGKTVTVKLASKLARAYNWTVYRVYLNLQVGLGINGFKNVFIDTDDNLNCLMAESNSQFLTLNILRTSNMPANRNTNYVMVNRNSIMMVEPIHFFDWFEINQERIEKLKK